MTESSLEILKEVHKLRLTRGPRGRTDHASE